MKHPVLSRCYLLLRVHTRCAVVYVNGCRILFIAFENNVAQSLGRKARFAITYSKRKKCNVEPRSQDIQLIQRFHNKYYLVKFQTTVAPNLATTTKKQQYVDTENA